MQVIIMCKAPRPGRVKTRLLPQYSAEQAASLHAQMAACVIERTRRLFDHVSVAADDPGHAFFSGLGLPVLPQGDGYLGERLARLLSQTCKLQVEPVMFLGTDSPHMPEQRLRTASDLISIRDVVFGPVEDGGYDLVAVKGDFPDLFMDIEWGTDRVLEQSLQKAAEMSLSVGLLDMSFDIDRAEDVERACRAGWKPADAPVHSLSENITS